MGTTDEIGLGGGGRLAEGDRGRSELQEELLEMEGFARNRLTD